jgi:SulP family sulfate permease
MGAITTAWPREVLGGLTCGIISIVYGLTYSALIFSGPLAPWLGHGIAASLMTGGVAAIVFAFRSSLPFAIAGVDNATAAVTATLAAGVASRLVSEGYDGSLAVPVLGIMALSATFAGLILVALGTARAGRVVRFVPYPVIGGFLAATGWLICNGAVSVTTGVELSLANLHRIFEPQSCAALLASAAVASVIALARTYTRTGIFVPGILLAVVIAFDLFVLVTGFSYDELAAQGWMFDRPLAVAPMFALLEPDGVKWNLLLPLSGELLAIAFVSIVGMLLNTTGIELATRRDADLDRDLTALGSANLASAALGGYVSCISLSRSTINYSIGATTRVSAVVAGLTTGGMLFVDPSFLSYVPKFVVGGLLLYIGLELLYNWIVLSFRRLLLADYLSLLAILLIIVTWGFIAGVVIGFVIGCATFAVSVSRVSAIKFAFDGTEIHSGLDRGPTEAALLAKYGHELQGMSLQSYLFFGSANLLYQHVKKLLGASENCRFLIFDFRLVTGIDSSATHSFEQIKQAAEQAGARIVLVNIAPDLAASLRAGNVLTNGMHYEQTLDRALEWCEGAIIALHLDDVHGGYTLLEWLEEAMGSREHAEMLSHFCTMREIPAGQVIARQGDPSRSMFFVLDGRVGIFVDSPGTVRLRVRSLGRQTIVGEMGLITGQSRSATIEAELDTVLYELDVESYNRVVTEYPALSQALLIYIIRIMSERLGFASRAIGVLHR